MWPAGWGGPPRTSSIRELARACYLVDPGKRPFNQGENRGPGWEDVGDRWASALLALHAGRCKSDAAWISPSSPPDQQRRRCLIRIRELP